MSSMSPQQAFKYVSRIARRHYSYHRSFTTQAKIKNEGDISSVFTSLSGSTPKQLPARFVDLKRKLLQGRENVIVATWSRLLNELEVANKTIAEQGSNVVPEIDYENLKNPDREFEDAVRERGVAIVRNVVSRDEARRYKHDVEAYVQANPQTKGKLHSVRTSKINTKV